MPWNWKEWHQETGLRAMLPEALQPYFDSSSDFWQAVNVEGETDRALALLGGAFVEAALGSLIRAKMVDDELGTKVLKANDFAKRIVLASALGLIRPAMAKEMNLVREIRNAFAHTLAACDFNSPHVKKHIDALYVRKPHPEAEIDWSTGVECGRDAFMWEVHLIGSYCEFQSAIVGSRGRLTPVDTQRFFVFEGPPEFVK
jgi:hypothetical protein